MLAIVFIGVILALALGIKAARRPSKSFEGSDACLSAFGAAIAHSRATESDID